MPVLTAAAGADGSGSGSPLVAARSGLPEERSQGEGAGPGLGGSPESGLSSPASPRFLMSGRSGTSRRLSRPTMAEPPEPPRPSPAAAPRPAPPAPGRRREGRGRERRGGAGGAGSRQGAGPAPLFSPAHHRVSHRCPYHPGVPHPPGAPSPYSRAASLPRHWALAPIPSRMAAAKPASDGLPETRP